MAKTRHEIVEDRKPSIPTSAEGSIIVKNVAIKASEGVYVQVQNQSTERKRNEN